MENSKLSSGYLSKRGPLPLHIWSKRFFVLEDPKPIPLERLRLVYEKNLKKRKSSSTPLPSSEDFESLNKDLFRSISTATVSAHPFLAYYKSNSPQDLLKPLGLIDLRKVKHVQVVCRKFTKDYVVSLKTEARNHLLEAPNVTMAKAWETSINDRRSLIEKEPTNVEGTNAFKETYEKLVQRTAFPRTASPSIQPANETSDATLAAVSDAEPLTDSEFQPMVVTTTPTDEESKPIVAETEQIVEVVAVETEITVVAEGEVDTETKGMEEVMVETETHVVEEVTVETETNVVEDVQVETETNVVEEVLVETESKVVQDVPIETETKIIEDVHIEDVPVEHVEQLVADETVEELAVSEPTSRKSKRKSFLVTALASMKKGKTETTKTISEPMSEEIVPKENSNEEIPLIVPAEEPKPESTVDSPFTEMKKAINSFFYPKKEPVTEPVADVAAEEVHEATVDEEQKPSKVSERDEIALAVEEAVEAAATEIASKEEEKKDEIVVKRKRSIFLQMFRQKKVIVATETEGAGTLEEKEDVNDVVVADVLEIATGAPVAEEVKVEAEEEAVVEELKDGELAQGEVKKEDTEAGATEIASKEEEKKDEMVVKRKRSMFLQLFRQKKVIVATETEGAAPLEEKEAVVVEKTAAAVAEVASDAPLTEDVKIEISPAGEPKKESVVEEPKDAELVQGETKKEDTEPVVEVAKPVASPLVRAFTKLFKVPRKSSVSEQAIAEICKETESQVVKATKETEATAADVVESETADVTEAVKTKVVHPVSDKNPSTTADVPSAAKKRMSMVERFNLFIGKPSPMEITVASKEDSNVTIVEGEPITKKEE